MRLSLAVTAIFALAHTAEATPLVTIYCDKPNGFNISYGTSLAERFEASQQKRPNPPPKLSGPNTDGYSGTPTFVIDSNRKDMTVTWGELPEDAKLRKQAKELNIPQAPPPPATEATIVLFMDEQISAIQVDPWSIMTFSFFPKTGTAFIGQQAMRPGSKDATQLATLAHCEFSWTNPRGR